MKLIVVGQCWTVSPVEDALQSGLEMSKCSGMLLLSLQERGLTDISLVLQTSFVSQPLLSERFASGASMHYYHTTPSISEFVNYIQETACSGLEDKVSCEASTASLLQADYIDLDFDSISHALILNAYWSKAPDTVGWTEKITKDVNGQDKVEVGVLANERTQDKEELSLGGFLAVVGEDEKLSEFESECSL